MVESHGMSNLVRRHVREVECVARATNNPIPVIAVDLVELEDGSATAAPDISYSDRAAAPGVPKRDGINAIEGRTGETALELPEPRICAPAATSHCVIAFPISLIIVVVWRGDPGVVATDHDSWDVQPGNPISR